MTEGIKVGKNIEGGITLPSRGIYMRSISDIILDIPKLGEIVEERYDT